MSELKTVKVDVIDPNPWRDGSAGTATWESVEATYPLLRDKLARLEQSYANLGVWEGIIAREGAKGRYELAFGHHRVKAAQIAELATVPVVVKVLSDDDMIRYMAQENAEEDNAGFYLTTMCPIEAVVQAYAAGRVELEKPDTRRAASQLRTAPSFVVDGLVRLGERQYNAFTVGQYLGWLERGKAADRVLTALAALELIERKVLNRKDFVPLGQMGAKALVDVTRARMKAEQADIDANVSVKREALAKAESEGDTRKVGILSDEVAELEKNSAKKIERVGKAAGKEVVEALAVGTPAAEIVKAIRPEPESHETAAVKTLSELVNTMIAKLEGFALDTDPKYIRILAGAKDTRAYRELGEAYKRAAERCRNRAAEIKGKS